MSGKAVEKNLPCAAFLLYIAHRNKTVKNLERTVVAPEAGIIARDANCLYILAHWLILGQSPVTLNETRGLKVMEEAAALGHVKAKECLRAHPS